MSAGGQPITAGFRIELYRSKGLNDYRFRLVSSNGEVIAQSEGYVRKSDCQDTVKLIQAKASIAGIVDRTKD